MTTVQYLSNISQHHNDFRAKQTQSVLKNNKAEHHQMLLQKMQYSMQREIHVCVHTVVTYSSHSDEQGHLIEVIGHTLRNDKIPTIIIYIHQQIL